MIECEENKTNRLFLHEILMVTDFGTGINKAHYRRECMTNALSVGYN